MDYRLFFNTTIHTLEHDTPYHWLLVGNGKIIALGVEDDPPDLTGHQAQKYDMHGLHLFPAFTDAHTHLVMTALNTLNIDLKQAHSLDQAVAILRAHAGDYPADVWVLGSGYDRNLWHDGQPHKKILDAIFPNHPVMLESKDCHSIWVNSLALKTAGIKKTTPDPPGGKIERDAKGQPTGLLSEQAIPLIKRNIPPPGGEQTRRALLKLFNEFHRHGITAVHTMEGLKEYGLLQDLANNGQLELRVTIYIPHQEMEGLLAAGMRSGHGNEWLKLGGIKIFADGSLGSQTAEMRAPYENDPDNFGIAHLPESELRAIIRTAAEHGLSPAVHAIGDAAVRKVLQAFEQAREWREKWNLVFRMEHAQLVPPEELRLFGQSGAMASMQPLHIADDVPLAEKYWGTRCAYAYPMAALLQRGVPLAFGSDTPVADFDPFKGMYSAVTRKFQLNSQHEPWHPEMAVSLKQAIKAYTIGGATASGDLHLRGTLSVGKQADFIAVDRDIRFLKPEEILSIRVNKTIMNGKIVYQI